MNSLALFVGGVILGVLISLSFVNRMGPNSVLTYKSISDTRVVDLVNVRQGVTSLKNDTVAAFLKPTEIPLKTNNIVEPKAQIVTNKIADTQTVAKTRWAPGGESNLAKLKSIADEAQTHFIKAGSAPASTSPAAETPPPVDETAKLGEGRLRPGKLKRKQMKELIGKRVADTTAATATSTTAATATLTATSTTPSTVSHINASLPRLSLTPNPLIPYHSQALILMLFEFKMSVLRSSAGLAPLPDISKQRGVHEKDNLKLHLCNGVFEAYSASYLTTKQHMLSGLNF